jgi:hypothetical protein
MIEETTDEFKLHSFVKGEELAWIQINGLSAHKIKCGNWRKDTV